jgi:hypothetical protein
MAWSLGIFARPFTGALSPSYMQKHSVGQLGYCLQVGIQCRCIEQNGRLPGGLLEGLAYLLHHLFGILVKHGVVLHDQEAVVVLLQEWS